MGKDRGTNGGKYVHTSGTSPVDLALWDHVDGSIVRAPVSGKEIKLWRRDCARCGAEASSGG